MNKKILRRWELIDEIGSALQEINGSRGWY